ncbi:LysM peptidoglycan-binding domain-containing protein [uncultured Cytophaga sp.]|uniref:LysM peptidoglycan-binding domain-containing protein n=1 Tax=uncultured Cytophaga sp. TaxID=160238 RepID=UPI002609B050|nr:LysM peptidoglycan-binding domain-containing protein [uncultured Cytophaga sp.]
MLRLIALSILSLCALCSTAQTFSKPEVPDVIEFGGMKLELTPAAKRKIEADVTMIYSSGKYLQQKIDRANLYFPIIEHVFHQEGFPEDFKFLALQESSLVSDAVSSSNAVGFWQFKKETAIEVGVVVNGNVDERKHISYASKGAATYIKKNNVSLDNWVYALLSYNVGPGGVKSHVKTKYVGAKHMVIDDDIHWYVIRFLAYKIAYQNLVGKANHPEISLIEYKGVKDKSFQEISKQANVEVDLLKEYNKWCTNSHVPSDKEYIVIIPSSHGSVSPIDEHKPTQQNAPDDDPIVILNQKDIVLIIPKSFPDIRAFVDTLKIPVFVSINKVKAIRASKGDDINSLVVKSGLSKQSFLYYNELKGYENVAAGNFYYMQVKRSKALVAYHTVSKGESLNSIAQNYAITTASIRKHNRMSKNEYLKENRVLWLRSTRPKDTPIEYKASPKPLVKEAVKLAPKVENKTEVVELKPQNQTVLVTPKQIETKGTSAPSSIIDANVIIHIVQPGESVFGLSRKYEADSDSIRAWNNLSGYAIQVNQKLIVGYKKKVGGEQKYVVKPGDTVYKISKELNVTVEDIKKWNNLPDYNLKIGQELIIHTP